MGFVPIEVGISSPAEPEREERVEVRVDTGAILSVIPRSILENLRAQPVGRRDFKGFGAVINRDIGE